MTIRGRTATVLVVVLVVSLALNFFAGGMIAAGLYASQRLAGFDRSFERYAERFPSEIRRAVAGALIGQRDDVFKALDALKAARGEMFAAMRAEPFDRARLDRAMEQVRARTIALQALGHAILANVIAGASAEVRARITPPTER